MKLLFNLIITGLFLLLGINACKQEVVKPIDKLPPATQEGKNTFGCLVNGEAWIPKGNNGTTKLSINYDPGNYNGTFDLLAYRYPTPGNYESIIIFVGEVNATGKRHFELDNVDPHTLLFRNSVCSYNDDSDVYKKGSLTITKFDFPNHIIAGTFEMTLARPGCDTIRMTDGRFDMKF